MLREIGNEDEDLVVGELYNLNPAAPYSLTAPGFNPLSVRSENLVS
jgi:hypothetical protein